MPRYRYTHTTPTVFINEIVDGRTWMPDPGEEAEFNHTIKHPYLQLIEPPAPAAPSVAPPASPVEAAPPEAITGEDKKES